MGWPGALSMLLLAGYGVAFATAALGGGLLAYDDHPGQLYRVHHVLALGPAPWRLNPGWWAGYAELQFYPPGFAYGAALLHLLALGALQAEGAYQVMLWLTYLLPGLAVHALLARVGGPWLALPGALLALTLCAESRSGVEEGLRWGLVAARLGWGYLALLLLALRPIVETGRSSPLAPLLLAAVILTHPAHAPAAVVAVVLAAATAPLTTAARAVEALRTLALGVGLVAFWLVPLVAHLDMALPLTWGDASLQALGARLVRYPLLGGLAAAAAAVGVAAARGVPLRPLERWLLWLLPATLVVVVAQRAVAAPLGLVWLPADRLTDAALLALVLAASVALAVLARSWPHLPAPALAAAAIAVAVALAPGAPEPTLSLWPRARDWPREAQIVRGARLDALWRTLADAPPGRVLFLRSSIPLVFRPEWWRPHSHLTALTPVRAGRAIVNGTFTHPSPVAGLVYTGRPAGAVTRLVEQQDGVSLFGRPLDSLRSEDVDRLALALQVTVLVALDEDIPRLGFLGHSRVFAAPPARIGPFVVHVAKDGHVQPARGADGILEWTPPPGDNGWAGTGLAYSPLWSASSADGRALATRRGALGLLEVRTGGGAGRVRLVHAPGAPEGLGLAVSGVALLGWLRLRRRRR